MVNVYNTVLGGTNAVVIMAFNQSYVMMNAWVDEDEVANNPCRIDRYDMLLREDNDMCYIKMNGQNFRLTLAIDVVLNDDADCADMVLMDQEVYHEDSEGNCVAATWQSMPAIILKNRW